MKKFMTASRFHPGAWWALGLLLAVCGSALSSIGSLFVLATITITMILAARESAPWAQSLKFYLLTSLAVIVIRLAFRIIFNFDASTDIALDLPSLTLDLGAIGELSLFGRVSNLALQGALRDGLRMASIILSIGLANTLANPRRLLKHTPGALYEVATTVVIAINLAPQLIDSAKRVKTARRLRGRTRRQNLLTSLLIPVLEDTIDRSLSLAASMDARGFGRQGSLTAVQSRAARISSLASVALIGIGAYVLLTTEQIVGAVACFVLALGGVFLTVRLNSLKHVKTRHRLDPWRVRDTVLVLSGFSLACAAITGWLG